MIRFGIIVFPGSNCDIDCYKVLRNKLKKEVSYIWHDTKNIDDYDVIILPGGFSYGDYLRSGAIARFAKVMDAVMLHAEKRKPLIGICNGFQILTEIGLLPGALIRNKNLQFICRTVSLKVENTSTPFSNQYDLGQIIHIPIAHGEGNYQIDKDELAKLEANKQVVFRYCDRSGNVSEAGNPNGSVHNIAGICNETRNVLGMMPHPERAAEELLGGTDGLALFESVIQQFEKNYSLAG